MAVYGFISDHDEKAKATRLRGGPDTVSIRLASPAHHILVARTVRLGSITSEDPKIAVDQQQIPQV